MPGYHRGCPCCPTRNRGLGKYTWQVLELDGSERWRKVTVPDGTTFTPEGYPSNWYRHGWTLSNDPGHEAGGVLVTGHAIMVEWGAEVGSPFSYIVTSRDISNGDLVATLELGSLDRFLGRLGADRVAILRVEESYSPDKWRIEVYDTELQFDWETDLYDSTATAASGFTITALQWDVGYSSGVLALLRYDGFVQNPDLTYTNNWSLVTFEEDGTPIADEDVSVSGTNGGVSFFRGGNGVPGFGGLAVDGSAVVLRRTSGSTPGGLATHVMSTTDGSFIDYYYLNAGSGVDHMSLPVVLWSSTQSSGRVNKTGLATSRPVMGTGLYDDVDWWYQLTSAQDQSRVVWASPDVFFLIMADKVQRYTQSTMDFEVPVDSTSYYSNSPNGAFPVSEDILVVESQPTGTRRLLVIDTGSVTFDGAVDDFFALDPSRSFHVCDASADAILSLHEYRANHEWGQQKWG